MKKMSVLNTLTMRDMVREINQRDIQKEDIVSLLYNSDTKEYVLFYYKKIEV